MTKKSQIYKCDICGNTVEVLQEGAGTLVCCGKPMRLIEEKHLPLSLSDYTLMDIIVAGIKSESESKSIYKKIAGKVKNRLLAEKFEFLASEEQKHFDFLVDLFKNNFPDKDYTRAGETPVPLPSITFENEDVPLSDIIHKAMEAEKAAREFYDAFAELMKGDETLYKILKTLSSMELGHYKLLEIEKDNIEKMEDYETGWGMIHLGP